MTRYLWVTFVTWMALECLLPKVAAWGQQPNWMPRAEHTDIALEGRDCAVYRTLEKKAEVEWGNQAYWLSAHKESLQSSRKLLETCAAKEGIANLDTPQAERTAAELCPTEYQAWLRPGYRYRMYREDRQQTAEDLQNLKLLISVHCAELPERTPLPVAVKGPESTPEVEAPPLLDFDKPMDLDPRY